jgi:hypothetical protein
MSLQVGPTCSVHAARGGWLSDEVQAARVGTWQQGGYVTDGTGKDVDIWARARGKRGVCQISHAEAIIYQPV